MNLKLPSTLAVCIYCISSFIFLHKIYAANSQSGLDEETKKKYKAAAPLNHTVKITRTGSFLKLDYELVDSDGKTYYLWKINEQSRPVFSIYHENFKLDDGKFVFG